MGSLPLNSAPPLTPTPLIPLWNRNLRACIQVDTVLWYCVRMECLLILMHFPCTCTVQMVTAVHHKNFYFALFFIYCIMFMPHGARNTGTLWYN
jgi:hypothetical protein